jgi:hypothetical protein
LQNLNPDFIQQIRLLYPKASESFFTAMSEAALTSVRLNPFKTTGVFEIDHPLLPTLYFMPDLIMFRKVQVCF